MTEINDRFVSYLAEGNILCHTKESTRESVVAELAALLARNNAGLDSESVYREVMAREALFPTVISDGLAVPHARITGLDRLLIAMATSVEGIDFGVEDMPKVNIVVLVLTPFDDPGLHLQLLTALAHDFRDPATVDRLVRLPDAGSVMAFFRDGKMSIPDFLRARDVMETRMVTLFDNDTLETAIRTFATTRAEEIPVLDNENDLRGVIAVEDILKFSLPEHILWMEDLSSVYRFQPFAEALKSAGETKVADFMREEFLKVDCDIPAVQLAKLFLVHKLRQIVVVGSDGRLAGVVNLKDFASKLFWE